MIRAYVTALVLHPVFNGLLVAAWKRKHTIPAPVLLCVYIILKFRISRKNYDSESAQVVFSYYTDTNLRGQ